jgi:hypothetical protein
MVIKFINFKKFKYSNKLVSNLNFKNIYKKYIFNLNNLVIKRLNLILEKLESKKGLKI